MTIGKLFPGRERAGLKEILFQGTRLKTIHSNCLTLQKTMCKMADEKMEDDIGADCDKESGLQFEPVA